MLMFAWERPPWPTCCAGFWPFLPACLQDPACMSYSQALLHFKGFHAIQVGRRGWEGVSMCCGAAAEELRKEFGGGLGLALGWLSPVAAIKPLPA